MVGLENGLSRSKKKLNQNDSLCVKNCLTSHHRPIKLYDGESG